MYYFILVNECIMNVKTTHLVTHYIQLSNYTPSGVESTPEDTLVTSGELCVAIEKKNK